MKKKIFRNAVIFTALVLLLLLAAKASGRPILRLYIETGIGNCQQNPILCITTQEKITNIPIDEEFISGLTRFVFKKPALEIHMPKDFKVICGEESRVYFKKIKNRTGDETAYVTYRKPNFFITSFPQVKKDPSIKNDFDFVSRTMNSKLTSVNNLLDAFFVIMKSIFTPDIGDQKNVKIISFRMPDKSGFISYDLTPEGNYFDCNFFNNAGEFFKLYIKDKKATLDLSEVMALISTLKSRTIKPY